MAKALGLIGNFKGKLGNTVGYSLKDSNNKQTQGVRVYQPVVRNPKTAAQAEQRAKLAPINATYRTLKMIIDRGQEGKAYGNKSRLAWLSDAIKAFHGGWFEKGTAIGMPALVPLTKGSLYCPFALRSGADSVVISNIQGVSQDTTTIGALSTALIGSFPSLLEGDQITFVVISNTGSTMGGTVVSFVVNKSSTDLIPAGLSCGNGTITASTTTGFAVAGAIILSREGENGAHLRSTTSIVQLTTYDSTILAEAAKQAAIESYMSQGANTDWAEESVM